MKIFFIVIFVLIILGVVLWYTAPLLVLGLLFGILPQGIYDQITDL